MRIAYFDCLSGISGDMILGALVGAGLDIRRLENELRKLGLSGYRVRVEEVKKRGINGVRFTVDVERDRRGRRLHEILEIIERSGLDDEIKEGGKKIFEELARIEARIHGEGMEEVYLHELGGIDSLIDIFGTLIGVKMLGVGRVYSSPLHLGRGFVKTQHGPLPIPSPATLELLKGLPIYSDGVDGELTTPTGAVLIKTLAKRFGRMPKMRLLEVGYGAGERELEVPNLLRVYIGEEEEEYERDEVALVQTNIDDMNPEFLDYIIQRLLDEGALDVFTMPVGMKKGRVGSLLSVLVQKELLDGVILAIFRETTTFGVRIQYLERRRLPRETIHVRTRYGDVRVKIGRLGDRILNISPEYEDCKRVALQKTLPLKEVYDEAREEARRRCHHSQVDQGSRR